MCCFSRPVAHVGATQIFARAAAEGRQLLVYSMNVRVTEPLAMILPLPVPPRPADDAVRFIDLSGYATFFRDLRAAFPPLYAAAQPKSRGLAALADAAPTLEVHRVGAFEASFVPSLDDFARLDERFRLAPDVWAGLPQYADWGFAVFQLAPEKGWLGGARDQTVHPMAFEFPRRDPRELFFPTVHIHDGVVHPRANFDHTLTCQVDGITAATLGWTRSNGPLGRRVDELRARGVVRGDAGGFATALWLDGPNRDTILRTPKWTGGDVLSATGDCWAARLRGTFAHSDPDEINPEWRPWCATALERLDEVFAALRDGVRELVERMRVSWQLAPWPGAIPEFWPLRFAPDSDGRLISFHPFTKNVEPQEIVLSFAEPNPDCVNEVEMELRRVLERALP